MPPVCSSPLGFAAASVVGAAAVTSAVAASAAAGASVAGAASVVTGAVSVASGAAASSLAAGWQAANNIVVATVDAINVNLRIGLLPSVKTALVNQIPSI